MARAPGKAKNRRPARAGVERTDAVVAAVGALLVALAVVGAAVNAPFAASYSVRFASDDALAAEGNRRHQAEAVRDQFTFLVNETNASLLNVTVTLSYVAVPPGLARLNALLTAPNGTAYEAQGLMRPPEAGQPESFGVVVFEVPLAPLPRDATVEAPDAEAALRQASPPVNATWVGEWRLDVAADGGPAPFAQATTAWTAVVTSWRGIATPAPVPAR